jgi:hypothetical protein
LGKGLQRQPTIRKNARVALAFASLLRPASFMAFALGLWRVASDMSIAGEFPIRDGVFSHWQVWIAGGFAVELCAFLLNRYGLIETDPEI